MSETHILIRLLQIYIPRNCEFGPAFSKLRNLGGGFEPPNHPPGYASGCCRVPQFETNEGVMHKQITIIFRYPMAHYSCPSSCSRSVSVTYRSPFFSTALQSPFRMPCVCVNHPIITFIGNLSQPHQIHRPAALWSPQLYFPPSGVKAPSGPAPPHYRGFTITLRHTTFGTIPLDEWSDRHRPIPDNKLDSQEKFKPVVPADELLQTAGLLGSILLSNKCDSAVKGEAIPLQPLTGPEGSSRLRLPDFKTIGIRTW
jgi:hypothetical protein